MKKPYKYTIICNKTNNTTYTNTAPLTHELQTWENTKDPNTKELKQTKTAYIDTRYKARLRLYKYVMKKQGKEIKKYNPYKGTEIGKTLPILNF